MKKIFFALLLFLAINFISCSSKQEWKGVFDFYPEKPEPGDEITVFYNSDSTDLNSGSEIELAAYLYSEDLDDAIGIEMKKVQNGWEGKFKTTKDTRGVLIKFKSDKKIDNNEKKGYEIPLYKDDKNIAGGNAGYGRAVLDWGSYYLELEKNYNFAMRLLEEDFAEHPEIKNEYLDSYLTAYAQLYSETSDSVVKVELLNLEKEKNLTENNLSTLIEWYKRIGDDEKSGKYKTELAKKFPESETLQQQRYVEFRNETNYSKKKELAEKFLIDFTKSNYKQSVYDLLVIYYRDNGQFKEALEFFKENKNNTSVFRFYSVNQVIFKQNGDSQIALEIAKLGVERAEKEFSNPSEEKPEYLTEKEWKEENEYYAGLNYFSLGKALYLTGNKKEAELNLEKAARLTKNDEGEVNEMYVKVVNVNGDKSKTKKIIEDFIKEGKSTTAMNDFLKEIYVSEKGSDNGFDEYLSQFKSFSLKGLESKLKSEMISKPAPKFSLEDLDGNKISLAYLKGKTVIVDFWATWCGPCISSFPGMNKAVQKYSNNPDVKFLFVNSWERVDDKKKSAGDFIKKNGYPFQVLMDFDNKVIDAYGVSGIPTKFIIDKNGNIRFVSVGFAGNTDQLVDEVSLMIGLVN